MVENEEEPYRRPAILETIIDYFPHDAHQAFFSRLNIEDVGNLLRVNRCLHESITLRNLITYPDIAQSTGLCSGDCQICLKNTFYKKNCDTSTTRYCKRHPEQPFEICAKHTVKRDDFFQYKLRKWNWKPRTKLWHRILCHRCKMKQLKDHFIFLYSEGTPPSFGPGLTYNHSTCICKETMIPKYGEIVCDECMYAMFNHLQRYTREKRAAKCVLPASELIATQPQRSHGETSCRCLQCGGPRQGERFNSRRYGCTVKQCLACEGIMIRLFVSNSISKRIYRIIRALRPIIEFFAWIHCLILWILHKFGRTITARKLHDQSILRCLRIRNRSKRARY